MTTDILLITLLVLAATFYEIAIWRANRRLKIAIATVRNSKGDRLADYVARKAVR